MSRIRLPGNHASKNHSTRARSHRKPAKIKTRAKAARASRRAAPGAPAAPQDENEFHPRVFVAKLFSFHRVCLERACRRAQRCTGGKYPPCFAFWRHVPEPAKMQLRAFVAARAEGADAAKALAAGEAAAARCEAEIAAAEAEDRARGAEPRPALAATTTAPADVARVRQL